jgi:hypothetical protein
MNPGRRQTRVAAILGLSVLFAVGTPAVDAHGGHGGGHGESRLETRGSDEDYGWSLPSW